jgi:hypothetical protein
MNLLPPLNKIFSMMMQHERQFKASIPDESKILINLVDYRKSQGKRRGNDSSFILENKRVCTFCGRNGHTIESCYRKHGFPPRFGKNHAIANHSSLEMGDMDDSKSCKGTG